MCSGQWIIDQGRLALRAQDQSVQYPDALEIFGFVFQGATQVAGLDCPPVLESLPELSMSRVPAVPAVRVWNDRGSILGAFGVMAGGSFHALSSDSDQVVIDSEWFPIDLDDLRLARTTAEELGVIGEEVRISALITLRTSADLPFDVVDDAATSSADLIATNPRSGLVAGIEATLYPYQEQGVRFLRMIADQRLGCILADEMGLGKTLQVISLIQAELNEGRRPALVVAPATLLENWRREIAKFAPGISVMIHSGGSRAGVASRLTADVILVSYETTINDESLLSSIPWHVVVLDEAQAIKNPEAQRTGAVKRLPRQVAIAVSGTPLENRVDDLWSVADFCLPGLLGTLEGFRREFADDVGDATRLAPIVGPLILRRRVADVATDLPAKIEILQPVVMSRRMAESYEATRCAVLEQHGPAGALVATSILRSFCAHPSLVGAWAENPAEDMPKYERLIEIL